MLIGLLREILTDGITMQLSQYRVLLVRVQPWLLNNNYDKAEKRPKTKIRQFKER